MLSAAALYLMHLQSAPLDLAALESLISKDKPAAEAMVRKHIPADELAKGSIPRDQGRRVLYAVDLATGGHKVAVDRDGKTILNLTKMESNLYLGVQVYPEGDAFLAQYVVDGKPLRSGLQVEVYDPNPFVLAPPGGRKGELREMGEWKSQIFPGTTRKWYIFLPPNVDLSKDHPVLIATDAQWDRDWIANGLENCAREGLIPPTVGVFIEPGQNKAGTYSNRSVEYDTLSPKYAQFLLEEILPQVEKIVKISQDPAKRALTGMSSGGICSFTACWERPEKFGVALSFIGSFANIASGPSNRDGGHNYPFLIRKAANKPIRVFLQDGENDLDNEFGNWWLCNVLMQDALRFKGYDHVWIPGKGFHNTKHARRIFDQALKWWLGKSPG